MRVVRLIFKNLEAVFSRLSPVFTILKKIYFSIPKFVRILVWVFIFLFFFFSYVPGIYRQYVYKYKYLIPEVNPFDMSGRQILTYEGGKLYLYNYYSCGKDTKVYSNSELVKFSEDNCSEKIQIAEGLKGSEETPPRNISTAIVNPNTIVWAEYHDDNRNWNIMKSVISKKTDGSFKVQTNTLVSLEKFDLDRYI